jgi:hypothetical protein
VTCGNPYVDGGNKYLGRTAAVDFFRSFLLCTSACIDGALFVGFRWLEKLE